MFWITEASPKRVRQTTRQPLDNRGEILFVFVPIYLPAHLFESGSTDLFEKIFLGRIFVVVIASNKVLKKELNGERGLLLRVKCRVGKKAACLVILR